MKMKMTNHAIEKEMDAFYNSIAGTEKKIVKENELYLPDGTMYGVRLLFDDGSRTVKYFTKYFTKVNDYQLKDLSSTFQMMKQQGFLEPDVIQAVVRFEDIHEVSIMED